MNRIIKVYSHTRSGTNYIMALLYRNFYYEMESVAGEVPLNGRELYILGEKIEDDPAYHPYVKLFGSHNPYHVTQDSIYIIRDIGKVAKSLEQLGTLTTQDIIQVHKDHIYTALQARPYVIYYEQLCNDPEKVLREIQYHFGFNRLYKNFITNVGYCGWKT